MVMYRLIKRVSQQRCDICGHEWIIAHVLSHKMQEANKNRFKLRPMKYRVEKLNESICSVKLVPENKEEETLLTQHEKKSTFQLHYQQALSKFVHKDASFLEVVNADHYPGHVIVRYELTNGTAA
jgi:hypothetical protein